MAEGKHTPGPWITRGHDNWMAYKDEDGGQTSTWGIGPRDRADPVAIVVHDGYYEDAEYTANARLIAAAPCLLEALRICAKRLESARSELRTFQSHEGTDGDVQNTAADDADKTAVATARAAIAKAVP